MKKFLRKIHLWIGLTAGLLVFIIAITGCTYTFQEEIQDVLQPYRFVKKENKTFLLPSKLEEIAKKNLPNKQLHSIKYHLENKSAEAIFYHSNPTYYYIIYLNPYSGEILHIKNMEKGFFPFILKGHYYLWLPPKIGQTVVAISTLLFLILIITGIILWLPKNWYVLKARTWFRWNTTTRWKRKNFDLHSIIGFYSCFIALIFIVTGLVWGFQWFAIGYYKSFGGDKKPYYKEVKSNILRNNSKNGIDAVFNKIISEEQYIKTIEVHPPESDIATINVVTNTETGTYWKSDYRYFNKHTLLEVKTNVIFSRIENATFADKLIRMNYDIHTGGLLGIWGKIFMFFMSLLIATLPITGFIFWIGKRKAKI
jgi:uncharacterized iron-regulated membrane protein